MLELVLDAEDKAGADAEVLCGTVAVELVGIAGFGERSDERQLVVDEPRDVSVPVVVVADSVADARALLVLKADRDVASLLPMRDPPYMPAG